MPDIARLMNAARFLQGMQPPMGAGASPTPGGALPPLPSLAEPPADQNPAELFKQLFAALSQAAPAYQPSAAPPMPSQPLPMPAAQPISGGMPLPASILTLLGGVMTAQENKKREQMQKAFAAWQQREGLAAKGAEQKGALAERAMATVPGVMAAARPRAEARPTEFMQKLALIQALPEGPDKDRAWAKLIGTAGPELTPATIQTAFNAITGDLHALYARLGDRLYEEWPGDAKEEYGRIAARYNQLAEQTNLPKMPAEPPKFKGAPAIERRLALSERGQIAREWYMRQQVALGKGRLAKMGAKGGAAARPTPTAQLGAMMRALGMESGADKTLVAAADRFANAAVSAAQADAARHYRTVGPEDRANTYGAAFDQQLQFLQSRMPQQPISVQVPGMSQPIILNLRGTPEEPKPKIRGGTSTVSPRRKNWGKDFSLLPQQWADWARRARKQKMTDAEIRRELIKRGVEW